MTAAEAWLKKEMERVAQEGRELGLPISLRYSMTFTEGGEYRLTIKAEYWETGTCPDCRGAGGLLPYEPGAYNIRCPRCSGTGKLHRTT